MLRSWCGRSIARAELLAEVLQAPLEQAGDGARCPLEAVADLGQRASLPVVEHQGLALVGRELRQRIGELDRLLVPLGDLARARARRTASQAPSRADDSASSCSSDRSRLTSRLSRPWARMRVGDVSGQDRPQPAGPFGLVVAPELLALLICLQQRLLHHVGGVDLDRRDAIASWTRASSRR